MAIHFEGHEYDASIDLVIGDADLVVLVAVESLVLIGEACTDRKMHHLHRLSCSEEGCLQTQHSTHLYYHSFSAPCVQQGSGMQMACSFPVQTFIEPLQDT